MAKSAPQLSFPMRPPRANESLSAWLHRELRTAILEGRLKPGATLPPTRALAAEHHIARGTVVRVFEQLLAEGYLESHTGSGTSVHRKLPDHFFDAGQTTLKSTAPSKPGRISRRGRQFATSPFSVSRLATARAFRANSPSVDHFPTDIWSRLGARRMRLASREMLLAGHELGYPPLREAIAAHLGSSRGVICEADQVMIVSGTQQALDLVARVTLDPSEEVWMEDPGYPGAKAVFHAVGAKVVPIPVDEKGLRVSEALKRAPHARLAYVTPANQFPLCVTLPLDRRLQLTEWSRTTGAWIFEDDYDSEFHFSGHPLAALQGLAPAGNVIFSGSFSKMLFPSLRMGFLVIPPHLVDLLRNARAVLDRYPHTMEQAVLCDFIAEGHFGRHLRRMRHVYAEHLDFLLTETQREWGERLTLQPTRTGLQTVAWLPEGRDAAPLAQAARASGVEVIPLTHYATRWKKRHGLQIGFAAVGLAELRRGTKVLAGLL